MTNKFTIFFNRISNYGYEFNQSGFALLKEAKTEILKSIEKDLIKRPKTTSSYLLSIYNEIEQGQKTLQKVYIVDVEKNIIDKSIQKLPKEAAALMNKNYAFALEALTELDEIKSYILEAILKIYPDSFNTNINSESPIFHPIPFKLKYNYFDTVLNALKDYFKEEQHKELFKLLEGKEINNSLMFNGNKNQLTELFKRLEYNDLIIIPNNKIELANWIVKNFTTKKGDYIFSQVYSEELSKTSFKIPTSKRILNSIECLSENKLKERNEINQNKSPLT